MHILYVHGENGLIFYCNILAAVFKELLPTADSISNGLYTIDVGQNDLTSAYVQGMTTEQVMAEVPDMIRKLVIVIQVKPEFKYFTQSSMFLITQ